jgi:hypothetical protein
MIAIRSSNQRQRGATLLVSLIMLVVLTLFAVAGFNLSSVNLRISGNFQDQKTREAAAQEAIEQALSTPAAFGSAAALSYVVGAYTVTVHGPTGVATGPRCNYAVTAKGYTKKIGELTPEDTDWEFRAFVANTATPTVSLGTAIVQGVRIRLLSGNCPV